MLLGGSYLSAINLTTIIRLIPTNTPGTIPAKNNALTLSPITYAYIIIIPEGGIIGPMTELAIICAKELFEYPCFFHSRYKHGTNC